MDTFSESEFAIGLDENDALTKSTYDMKELLFKIKINNLYDLQRKKGQVSTGNSSLFR